MTFFKRFNKNCLKPKNQTFINSNQVEKLKDDKRQMIKSVVELEDTIVREVMVPRTSMEVLEKNDTLKNCLDKFLKTGFSRMPVIAKNTDTILGVAYFKDVVRTIYKKTDKIRKVYHVDEIVRKAVFVPESMSVNVLLKQMQTSHSHIAIVIDEYGGVAGLVTLEDALEEIVGEVIDEFDKNDEIEPVKINTSTYEVNARMSIDDLAELFNINLKYDDIDTVGGLFNKALGKIPKPNSEAEIDGLKLTANKVIGVKKQVSQILVSKKQ
ncbi:MAG: hemolysin family protein [Bifidobacteriaceae bacterium]|jgi:CBS domain containing-hemolysin-like protein|nr:hemolysin family protein [Bifidobacteriaceae bacterium]